MMRSSRDAVGRTSARLARAALALAPALLLLAGPLPASAGSSPSAAVEVRLIAQAGLSVGFAWNLVAQSFDGQVNFVTGGCNPMLFGTGGTFAQQQNFGSTTAGMLVFYYDAACRQPYVTDAIEIASAGTFSTTTHAAQLVSQGGGVLGALTLIEAMEDSSSLIAFSHKGTYRASGSPRAAHIGLACREDFGPSVLTIICQEGVAQDFPSLKLALGTIAHMQLALNFDNFPIISATVTGTGAQLATGKLGGLSVVPTSLTTLGFQGKHAIVGTGSLSGSSPSFGLFQAAGAVWSFNDSKHATKFSIATAVDLTTAGKVTDTKTHAPLAAFQIDPSGTGAINYSDKTKAKIANWTLTD